jgi:hypothetical protein
MPGDKHDESPQAEAADAFEISSTLMQFQTNRPTLHVAREGPPPACPFEGEEFATVDRIVRTGRLYRKAMRDLLGGPYKEHAGLFPRYVTSTSNVIYFFTDDGVMMRYEPPAEGEEATSSVGKEPGGLAALLPRYSDGFVVGSHGGQFSPDVPGIEVQQCTIEEGRDPVPIGEKRRLFVVVDLDAEQTSEGRPRPLGSATSTLTAHFFGDLLDRDEDENGRRFMVRTSMRLPVTWDAIECYKRETYSLWDPAAAKSWAEQDIHAAITRHHVERSQLFAIDPSAATRARYMAVFAEFESLLDGPEEPIQQFLTKHPFIVSPRHEKVWPKLRLGVTATKQPIITDFVFREPTDRYELVELERANLPLFRKDGVQTAELTHAIDQTIEWERYIGDNVGTVRQELGLTNIEPRVPRLVVMGRSRDLNPQTRRKVSLLSVGGLRVMTYDDLIAASKAALEHLVGPLWDAGPNAMVYYPEEDTS